MRNYFFILIFMATLSSCGETIMKCNDESVTDLVSEIAIEIFHDDLDQAFVKESCTQANTSMLYLQGVNCSELFSTFLSTIFYADQANVSSVRTTSASDSGIQYCAADIEYIIDNRNIENLIKNYFSNANINDELRNTYTKTFAQLYSDIFSPVSNTASGVYNVQLTDDGDNFYVNLEVDLENAKETPLN